MCQIPGQNEIESIPGALGWTSCVAPLLPSHLQSRHLQEWWQQVQSLCYFCCVPLHQNSWSLGNSQWGFCGFKEQTGAPGRCWALPSVPGLSSPCPGTRSARTRWAARSPAGRLGTASSPGPTASLLPPPSCCKGGLALPGWLLYTWKSHQYISA